MSAPRSRQWALSALLLLATAVLAALHFAEDVALRVPAVHVLEDVVFVVVWLGGLVLVAGKLHAVQRSSVSLTESLEATRRDLAAFRRGLGDQIERQLRSWKLTPSEQEVAQLLLKGLGHREIADIRDTSEKTVRQQAAAVYRKAQVSSRAELSAYFLEDLLVLHSGRAEARA